MATGIPQCEASPALHGRRQVKDGCRRPRKLVHAQAHVNAATLDVPVQALPFTFLRLPNHLVRNSDAIPLLLLEV